MILKEEQQSIQPRPDNYLVWAILTTICCCLPFGIVSIVYAAKVNGLYAAQRYVEANEASAEAKKWAIIAGVTGAVINGIYFVWYLTVGAAAMLSSF